MAAWDQPYTAKVPFASSVVQRLGTTGRLLGGTGVEGCSLTTTDAAD